MIQYWWGCGAKYFFEKQTNKINEQGFAEIDAIDNVSDTADLILRQLAPDQQDVLDIGSGFGGFAVSLVKAGARSVEAGDASRIF